jgi:MFS superfamily sulfate permease-like transporter
MYICICMYPLSTPKHILWFNSCNTFPLSLYLFFFFLRAFFGCLLVLIGIDLCVEWLWGARTKMAAPEYAVNVLTFLFCLVGGVEAGIALGFIASMIAFITGYAAVPTMTTSSVIKLTHTHTHTPTSF